MLQFCHSKGEVRIDEAWMTDQGIQVEGAVEVSILYVTSDDSMPFAVMEGDVPFSHLIEVENAGGNCRFSLHAGLEQLSAAMKNGTYAFRLHLPAQSITTDTRQLGLIREFPDCSFFLDFMDTDCTYSDDLLELTCSCDNLAFLVPFGSLQSRQLVDLLNARQRIYGVCRTYDNTNAAERISDSQISEMLSWGSPLLFFLAAADTTQDNRLLVDNAILDARLHQTYPALLIHLDADVARIQQLLLSSRKNL